MHFRTNFALIIAIAIAAAVGSLSAADLSTASRYDGTLRIADRGVSGIDLTADLSAINLLPIQGDASEATLDGDGRIGMPGMPDLPSFSRLLVVPPTAGIQLSISASEPRLEQGVEFSLYPSIGERGEPEIVESPAFRRINGFWPENVATLDPPVIMRGVRMVRVTINPVRINPATGEALFYDEVNVSLDFTNAAPINPVVAPERPRPSAMALKAISSIVSNPEALMRDEAEEKGAFVYVIPNFDGVEAAIQPLVSWRKRQGYPTQVITVARNASNVDVKNALQDAYDDWEVPPEIICLIGEADLVNADFMIATWDVGRAYMWETDYKYGLLEGQDLLPEAAVARISVRSLNELRSMVTKIVGYETDPDVADTSWFTRAAVMANDPRTGYSSIYLQRWARKLLTEVGFASVDTFFFIHQNQESDHDFIRRNINEGISVFNYRGWGQFNGAWVVGDVRELRNARKMPLLILPTCNTCDFADHILTPWAYAEDFLWAQGGGAIGTIGSSGFTHTNYNNVLDGGVLNSFYRDGIWTIGWALNRGKLELYRHFGMFNDVQDPQVQNLLTWEAHCYQFNLIGDPGTELWTGLPRRIDVALPNEIIIGEQALEMQVTEANNDAPLAEVIVTLMLDDEILRVDKTDAEGRILFTFDPDELVAGDLIITTSKHNIFPRCDTLEVRSGARFVATTSFVVDDDNAGRSRGNGDRTPNPGEIVELRTYVANFGDQAPQGRLDLTLSVNEGEARIVTGQATINQAPAAGDSAVVTFLVEIGTGNANDSRLVFDLEVVGGNETWNSVISMKAASCNLEYVRHVFTPNPFRPGDTAWVDITLRNQGRMTSPVMAGRLISLTPVVNIFNPEAEFTAVSVDGNDSLATARFRIYAHTLTVPGTMAKVLLTLQSESGVLDTASFAFQISTPQADTPFGPDAYGYVCFDNTDEQWDVSPTYEWVEIDTGLGGTGTLTDIRDQGNEQDWSVLVDLPFSFRYYGRDFNEMTICSNGWVSFGDESKLADFQNRRIPPALGPRAQVCVFWDDLINYMDGNDNQIGGVFYKYDEENNRFIVEWSRMRRYVGMDEDGIRPGSEESFQAIFYDPQHYPTYTGDGEIVMQYRDISNDPDVDPGEFDTPYATVGIVNLNGTGGMEYTYWNSYAPGAAQLADERAIKFSTKLIVVVGYARGTVRDAATNQPIPGAEIRANRGSFATTDRNGSFMMENVLIGEDYSFTAWAPGYNDSTLTGFDVTEADTVSLNFSLLHPTFSISRNEINSENRPGFPADFRIQLRNEGNGPLAFSSRYTYPGEEADDGMPRILDFNATDSTNDNRIQAVDYFNGKIWVAGSNNNANPNRFYRFNNNGTYGNAISQPGTSNFGVRGTTTDGTLLYGGEGDWIIGMNNQGVVIDSIPGPLTLQKALAYDSERDAFWVANGADEPLVCIDRDGLILSSFQYELDISGLGYFPDDQDGFTVYLLSRNRTNPGLQVPEALVSKVHPETGENRVITPLEGLLEDRAGEMEITSAMDGRKWVLLAVMTNANGTRISAYDMGPNTVWLDHSPRTGRVEAGASTTIELAIKTDGLEEGVYGLVLQYLHNAAGLKTDIPIQLTIDDEASVEDEQIAPLDFALGAAFPNPFNSTAVVPFSLLEAGMVRMALYDLAGREVALMLDGRLAAGHHSTSILASELPSGVYIVKLESAGLSRTQKIALIR